jgi:hypothetical protein
MDASVTAAPSASDRITELICKIIDAVGASAEHAAALKDAAAILAVTPTDKCAGNTFLWQCMQLPRDKLMMLATATQTWQRVMQHALDEKAAVAELEAMLAGLSVRSAD